jgi:hypothetical protein
MLDAAHVHLVVHKEAYDAFQSGKPEVTLIWFDQEFNVWCRARLDWLHDSYLKIDDLKTTGITANPEALSRTMFSNGWDVQAAFYLRGLRILTGKDAIFRFIAQENEPPYALSVIGVGPDVAMLGEKKVRYALETFARCLKSGVWEGYPVRTCFPGLPEWEEARWLRKEMEDVRI